jgi:UDP-N-acetylglucosamine--N-acetylmuramyl-(pentapeptide) pyrophosphoryl-undecaprenol N-acetylglucosamine transferase
LGHVTRVLDVADRLHGNGHEFCYSGSLQALKYLRLHQNGSKVLESPSLDVEWTEDGSFSSKDFIPHFPSMFNSFLKQIAFESESISRFDPSIVVSDSRLSPVIAARRRSYPVVTLLNQFKVNLPPRFRSNRTGRLYERIAGDVLGLLWSLSDRVLMTDLPPPYTIGEANLQGTDVSKIVQYVGFTSPRLRLDEARLARARSIAGLDGKPLVFVQISGPDATKKRFADTVLRATDQLAKRYDIVISLGYLNGSGEPRRLSNGTVLYDWCPIKDELFELSSLVVARSGHRTIGQCIDSAKPAVLIPIHNHPEQIGNAEKFASLGLGVAIKAEDLTPQLLTESVDRCLNDSSYRKNIDALSRISEKYDGIQRTVEIINAYN